MPIAALKNNSLVELNLPNSQLFAEDFLALFQILPHNRSITQLNFSNNFLAFRQHEKTKGLTSNHEYYQNVIDAFVHSLEQHSRLTLFDISGNDIGSENVVKICKPLSSNVNLECFNISTCKIGALGAKEVCRILIPMQHIQYISLSNNAIGNEGARAVSELLFANHNILELDLFNNNIGREGGLLMASSLTTNFIIQKLSIGENSIEQNEISLIKSSVVFNIQYAKMKATNERFGEFGHNLMAESLKRWVTRDQFVEEKLKARLRQGEDDIDRKMAELLLDERGNLDLKPIQSNYAYTTGDGRVHFEG